jgi:hypothetical protein
VQIYLAVCVGILTLTHVVGLVFWIATLVQLRRASESIEVLAYRAQDQVSKVGDATDKLRVFAGSLRSGWVQALAAAFGVATTVWVKRKDARGREHVERESHDR